MNFTTLDSDNNKSDISKCAQKFGGAWWLRKCGTSILNRDENAIWVSDWAVFDVQYSRMLVRLQ